jgi:N utilization substance protein A
MEASMAVSANRLELLQIADAVAREKSIDRQIVLQSMEEALQKAARSRYGQETEVRADINPKTGEIRFSRLMLVVEQIESDATQITLDQARKKNPAAQMGDWIAETLPPFDFGRIPAQAAKQVIVQKVREAERDRQYDEYKDRIGEIVNGIVKRVEYGNVIVDLGRGEAIIRRDELIPREMFRPGDRVRAYLYDVRREQRGPQIFMSRTHPQFMAKLFAQEVPEIYDGIIEVKSVARDPGSRAKIGVISRDSSIDPVGACVGMRGSRVQAVVNELQGEKIDIIPWSADAATFIVNALQPAEVVKVVLDEDSARIEVVVPDDQLSLAIGRRGQNVRLASQLTGWDIDILTEAEESERRQKEFQARTQTFMQALDVDEVVGQLLASEGFRTVEELAYVDISELATIEGFDEETATEIQNRARDHLNRIEAEFDEKRRALGVADELRDIPGVTTQMLVKLGENDVKTVEDLAGCATDDLTGYTERNKAGETVKEPGFFNGIEISREDAEAIIMAARVHAGWIDASVVEPAEAPTEEVAETPAPAAGA